MKGKVLVAALLIVATAGAAGAQNQGTVYAHVGGTAGEVLQIALEDNSSAHALVELLAKGDVRVAMEDYGNFEKTGELGSTLPRNDVRFTTGAGDVILYLGRKIVIYYDTNTWSFTRLGKVQGRSQSDLVRILGKGSVEVTFSLSPTRN